MVKYVLITSDTPEKVVEYLKRNGMDFRSYDFNPVIDLSDVDFHDRTSGTWRDCDNFIEGLEWEDSRSKPRNDNERLNGMQNSYGLCNRGWTKWRCRAYQGLERFLKWGGDGKKVTDNNPKGVVDSSSWITCQHCDKYSPKTLEGRKGVLETIRKQYEKELAKLDAEISQLAGKLDNVPDSRG